MTRFINRRCRQRGTIVELRNGGKGILIPWGDFRWFEHVEPLKRVVNGLSSLQKRQASGEDMRKEILKKKNELKILETRSRHELTKNMEFLLKSDLTKEHYELHKEKRFLKPNEIHKNIGNFIRDQDELSEPGHILFRERRKDATSSDVHKKPLGKDRIESARARPEKSN
ncbi:MAG: hypothetical protein V1672_02830 [Candidatus Diapherotrites archaeon]